MSKLNIENLPYLKTVNLSYKYRLYPTIEQETILNHQIFIYNQAYNICLNLWKKVIYTFLENTNFNHIKSLTLK